MASTLPVAWPPAGMTRDEIRTTLEHANSDYDIIVTFNDDDTIRSISGVRYSGRVDLNLTKPC